MSLVLRSFRGTCANMTEVLLGHDLVRSSLESDKVSENSLKNGAPRSEFFLMTGDKMINLNHKISPRYAEVLPQNCFLKIYCKAYVKQDVNVCVVSCSYFVIFGLISCHLKIAKIINWNLQ